MNVASELKKWEVQDVLNWLQKINMARYIPQFAESLGVDGTMLYDIKNEDLEKDLGISIRLHRVKILDCIEKLKSHPDKENKKTEKSITLKAVEGPLLGQQFTFSNPLNSIGRHSASNDIIIPESFVSRKHCQIHQKPEGFYLEDLGSTTGTFVMVKYPVELRLGQLFQLGTSEFRVACEDQAVIFEVYEGPAKGQTVEIAKEGVKIGRDLDNDFSVSEDSQMSGHHASVVVKDGKFWMQDEGSTNKTWIRLSEEGMKSEPYKISQGDIIKLGSSVFVVQPFDSTLAKSETVCESLGKKKSIKLNNSTIANVCKICYTTEANGAFIPCGHNFTCFTCAKKCDECPICRGIIVDVIRIFKG